MPHIYFYVERYVYDIINVVRKEQVDTIFNHLNSVDPHI